MPITVARAAAAFWLLIAALPIPFAGAETVCLTVATGERKATFPVAVGDKLALAFTHSIYGSQVAEHFRIGARAFQPVQLRYAELRLVEFYGRESARREDGWWVVDESGVELAALDLRASQDASMRVVFRDQQISLGGKWSPTGKPVAPSIAPVGRNPEQEPPAKAEARVEGSSSGGHARLSVSACPQKNHG